MLCPTWMSLKSAQGDIACEAEDTKIEEFAKEHGITVLPLIVSSDAAMMHELFTKIENRARLARNIVTLLDSFKYVQGINLDFEGLRPEDRHAYNQFLLEISTRLKAKGYMTTIDVPAKTHEDPKHGWSGAFDYAEIARYCDILMIMTYDEHVPFGDPGPVSSVQFDDDTLRYATSLIPKEKIFLGLPFYGYDWQIGKGTAGSYRYDYAMDLVKEKRIKINWDSEGKVPWYSYTDNDGVKRICYYEDARSIAAKLEIGKKWDVGGVCIWSLGGEDPGVWNAMREFRKR